MNLNARRTVIALMLALLVSLFATSCSQTAEEKAQPTKPAKQKAVEPAFDERGALIKVTNEFLSGDPKPFMKPQEVYDTVIENKDDSYQLVDLRSPDHYALGHVEGAINIPFKKLTAEEELAKLDKSKTIICICYTGHLSSYAVMYLTQLGYRAKAMQFGMTGWTRNKSVYGLEEKKIPTGKGADYPVSTEETTAEPIHELPVWKTGSKTLRDTVLARTREYFHTERPFTTSAAFVYEVVKSNSPDYQIVSIRDPEHYAIGHIPTAINIPRNEIARPENLKKLDPNKTIIVYCYTGHNSSMVSMFLNQLGYKSIALYLGMSAWTNDEKVRAKPAYDPSKVQDLPVVK
jgi:rhodanese-related sulfurtransferase